MKILSENDAIKKIAKLYQMKKYDLAVSKGIEYLQKYGNSYKIYNVIAMSFTALEQYQEAETYYKESISLNPNISITYGNLANVYCLLEKSNEALNCYNKAVKLDSKNFNAINNLGILYQNLGDNQEAINTYKKALLIDHKNSYLAYFNIGNVYRELGLNYLAIEHYEKAKSLNPNHLPVKNNLGLVHYSNGSYEEAIKEYLEVIEKDPKNTITISNIASSYRALGKFKKALNYNTMLSNISNNELDNAQILSNRGAIEFDAGKFEEAYESYKEALDINPKLYETFANVCLIFHKTGRFEKLNDWYKRFYDNLEGSSPLYSENEVVNRQLAKIKRVVALVKNSGRTGSIFFHSLLDGHPEILTTPGVYFKGFFHPSEWKKLYIGNDNKNWRQILVKNFLSFYSPFFDANSQIDVPGRPMSGPAGISAGLNALGENKDISLKLDADKFSKLLYTYLEGFDEMNRATFFKLIHLVYYSTINRKINDSILFFHIHNPSYLESVQFIKDFPDANYLQIIRNPMQSLESWLNIKPGTKDTKGNEIKDKDFNDEFSYVNKFATVLNYLNNPAFIYSDKNAVIRLEDIKNDPINTLNNLCSWLGIKYNESLETPSFEGHYYWGVSKTTPNIKGFSNESVDRKIGILFSKKDQKRLDPLFELFNNEYDYSKIDSSNFIKNLDKTLRDINDIFDFEIKLFSEFGDNKERNEIERFYFRTLIENFIKEIKLKYTETNFPRKI